MNPAFCSEEMSAGNAACRAGIEHNEAFTLKPEIKVFWEKSRSGLAAWEVTAFQHCIWMNLLRSF